MYRYHVRFEATRNGEPVSEERLMSFSLPGWSLDDLQLTEAPRLEDEEGLSNVQIVECVPA